MASTKKEKKTASASNTKKKGRQTKSAKKAETSGPPIEPAAAGEITAAAPPPPSGMVYIWEDDPMAVPARQPIQVPAPTLPTGELGIRIIESAPTPELHPVGTARFRYWTAAESLSRGMQFWQRFMPTGAAWSTPDRKLNVYLDFGVDINAYYRRSASRLEFYHATVAGRTVYSGESPNIVCHELGHAVLDALQPELYLASFHEAAAFHESFGDISAILCGLQLNSVAQEAINLTGGRLFHSTFLSRLAEELGWAIRQSRPQNVEPDCLRNAVNAFFYRDPLTLPPSAPASALSSAPHSFSRVFTAAFYDALAGMIIIDNANPTVSSIQKVTRDAGRLLVDAILRAPVVTNYFSQIAAQVIAADERRFRSKYRDVLKGAFVRRGILSLEAAASIVGAPKPVTAALGIAAGETIGGDTATMSKLIPLPVPTAALGVGAPEIFCAAPAEVGGFTMAAAAALDTGSLPAPSYTDATKSFVEDLLRLGRVDLGAYGDPVSQISQPSVRKTHRIEKEEFGLTLVRETFDCGFD